MLGLTLKFQSPEWTEFATVGITIALHNAETGADVARADVGRADVGGADDANEGTPAGRCQIGFSVDDLDGFHEQLKQKGVICIQPPTEEFGAKLARYLDIDGLQFSISQKRTC